MSSAGGRLSRFSNSAIHGELVPRGAAGDEITLIATTKLGVVVAEVTLAAIATNQPIAFSLPVTIPPNLREVHVYADGIELAGSPIAVGAEIVDSCLSLAGDTICGTLTLRAQLAEPPAVTLATAMGEALAELTPVWEAGAARFSWLVSDALLLREDTLIEASVFGQTFATLWCHFGLTGHLDRLEPARVSGWLFCAAMPSRRIALEAWRDGERAGQGECDQLREDLAATHPAHQRAGFDFGLRPPARAGAYLLSLRLPGSSEPLFGGPFLFRPAGYDAACAEGLARLALLPRLEPGEARVLRLALASLQPGKAGFVGDPASRALGAPSRRGTVAMIVAVAGAGDIAMLKSALASMRAADVVVASPVSAAAHDAVAALGLASVLLLPPPQQAGSASTAVARALRFASPWNVVIWASPVPLAPGALAAAEGVAAADPAIATVSSLRGEAAAAPASCAPIKLPAASGDCVLVRREALAAAWPDTAREWDLASFSAAAAALGFGHVAAPVMSPSGAIVAPFARRQADWPWQRQALAAAGRRFEAVFDTWLDGGTRKAIADISACFDDNAAQITVRVQPDGTMRADCAALSLSIWFASDEAGVLLDTLAAASPARVLVHQLLGYDAVLLAALPGFLRQWRSLFFVHDYYSLCPRVTMVDAAGAFCNLAADAACLRCVALGGAHPASRATATLQAGRAHRAQMRAILQACTAVIAPSEAAASLLRRGMPEVDVQVIPHPLAGMVYPAARRAGDGNQIAVIGAVAAHKGAKLLLALAKRARLLRPELRFRLIGHSDCDWELRGVGNVTIHGPYAAAEIGALLAATHAATALFLPIWPETFSYTLSEAVAAGLMPVVPDMGAPAERLLKAGGGVIVPLPLTPACILAGIDQSAEAVFPACLGEAQTASEARLRELLISSQAP